MLSGIGSHSSQLRLDTSTCALRYPTQQAKTVFGYQNYFGMGFGKSTQFTVCGLVLVLAAMARLILPARRFSPLPISASNLSLVAGLSAKYLQRARAPSLDCPCDGSPRSAARAAGHIGSQAQAPAPASHVAEHLLQLVGTLARSLRGLDPIRVECRRSRSLRTALWSRDSLPRPHRTCLLSNCCPDLRSAALYAWLSAWCE